MPVTKMIVQKPNQEKNELVFEDWYRDEIIDTVAKSLVDAFINKELDYIKIVRE